MKTTSTKLALVFIFLVQLVLAQDAHEQFESTFSDLSINQVVEILKIKKRYAEESSVQTLVDTEYSTFQSTMHEELESGSQLSEQEIELRIQSFLVALKNKADQLPKNPSENFPTKMWDGPCVNMDFEDGDLNGWTLSVGEADGSVVYSYVNDVPAGPGPNHQIFGGGVDPVVGIPRVNPGGAFSVRLGNGAVNGAGAARMSQSFLVDATNYFFTYSYAVVFQNPDGHTAEERPYFTVRVFDEFGGNIDCGEYSVYADPLNATDYQSIGDVLYKDWTMVFTNLSAFIGQNVTIEFTTGDCSLGGHYGYAYLDASCGLQDITATEYEICPGETSILTAPDGIGSYLWSTGETTQSITVNAGGNYTCLLTPLQGAACSIMLDVIVTMLQEPIASLTLDSPSVCIGEAVLFTDNSNIAAPATITSYQWDFGNGIVTPASTGAIVAVPNTVGTYLLAEHDYAASGAYNPSLTIVSNEGCTDTYTLPLTIIASPIVAAGLDQAVCDGVQVTLNGAGANTYSWDNGVTNGIAFNAPIGTTIYTVTGTSIDGCEATDQVEVTVYALPIVNAGLDQAICSGEQVTLSGSGALDYTWDNGITDGLAFTPAVGTIDYTVTGTDANGCEDTDIVQVIVHALPVVDAGLDQIVCDGEQVTLSGSGALNYSWDNGVTNGIAFTPAVGTLIYTMTGTNINGCEDTDQVSVTVNPLPAVNAGLDQAVCDGIQVTLNGAGANTYSWNNGVANGVAFNAPVGTTIYTVTGTSIDGCEATDQVEVTVYALPIVNAGLDQAICSGEQVTLSGAGAVDYTWDNGITDGLAFTPAVGTIDYTVTGTDVNGCEDTDVVQVIVHALPVVDAGLDQIVCDGEQVTLSGSGSLNYSWDNGVSNGIAFIPAVGTLIYTMTGTDINGCEDTDQVSVTVNPLPAANAGIDQIECDGETVTLSASGALDYSWNNGVVDGVPFIPTVGIHIYTVTGTDINGCENDDNVQVTINPNPVVGAGANKVLCEGGSVTLSGIGATAYAWNNGVVNGVPFTPALGVQTYTLIGSFATGCSSIDSLTVTVHPNPNVTTHDAEICRGESVTLKGFGADAYVWTNGVIDNVPFYPTNSGDYFVTGTTIFGCSGSAVAKVIVHELPTANFYMTNDDFSIIDPSSMFMNTSSGAVSYIWDFNDGSPSSTEVSPYHEFPSTDVGTYMVQLTAISAFGCKDSTVRMIEIKEEVLFYVPNAFTPDGDNFNGVFNPVFMDGFDPRDYTLYIFNRWGQIVFESHDTAEGWDGRFGLGGDYAQDGVYTWKIIVKAEHSNKTGVYVGHVSLLR
jgi:gliding motility-associated-like protein